VLHDRHCPDISGQAVSDATIRGREGGSDIATRGYYGLPVIHGPHWKWLVIAYFFFGGISGATATIGGIARLAGGRQNASVARVATHLSLAAMIPCAPLLILDLRRPRRFLNMLRVFRPSSPMSIGSWGFAIFGAITTSRALLQVLDDTMQPHRAERALAHASRALAASGAAAGMFVAGYTGVLLSATAVPLWSKRPAMLAPLFLSSAMASGSASISLASGFLGDRDDGMERLHDLEAIASIAETMVLFAWVTSLGPTAKPLLEGRTATVARHGVVGAGIVAPLLAAAVTRTRRGRAWRALSIAGSVAALIGGFAIRYVVVVGGRASADDPRATFDMTG
jgi:formate-dependent nitrite reductase membrane component NrfD